MKKIKFCKMEGAGNDFILLEGDQLTRGRKEFVKKICDRRFGIGADGVVFLDKPQNKKNYFNWDFYNSDGSSAEACMNASRCVVKYAELERNKKAPICFETRAGQVKGRCKKNSVQLELENKYLEPQKISLQTKKEKITGFFINTGVPHFVVVKKSWSPDVWKELARDLQNHKQFAPRQTNVTFMVEKNKREIRAITFERGVCDWTLACGTGAIAAALTQTNRRGGFFVVVKMPGGILKFYTKKEKHYLVGPANRVYNGYLTKRGKNEV